ncbi:MAG: DUF4126 domain-containing protein [Candidatus Omnitrophica bacterium]|nr:DUF4126 domain-containing protein [Candidatus Omnitrophota bacterium]
MESLGAIPVVLGGSWGSGVNLYLTTAGLGIAQRLHLIELPGSMDILAHPLIIVAALLLYGIEFFADKIPYVDSAWDSIHTFIRPAGGAALGYMAAAGAGPALQIPVALLAGGVTLESHLTKATARAAINTSPEPITNSVASVTEDVSVVGILYLIINHPVIASIVVILFIFVSIWFLKKMFRFLKRIFNPSKKEEIQPQVSG